MLARSTGCYIASWRPWRRASVTRSLPAGQPSKPWFLQAKQSGVCLRTRGLEPMYDAPHMSRWFDAPVVTSRSSFGAVFGPRATRAAAVLLGAALLSSCALLTATSPRSESRDRTRAMIEIDESADLGVDAEPESASASPRPKPKPRAARGVDQTQPAPSTAAAPQETEAVFDEILASPGKQLPQRDKRGAPAASAGAAAPTDEHALAGSSAAGSSAAGLGAPGSSASGASAAGASDRGARASAPSQAAQGAGAAELRGSGSPMADASRPAARERPSVDLAPLPVATPSRVEPRERAVALAPLPATAPARGAARGAASEREDHELVPLPARERQVAQVAPLQAAAPARSAARLSSRESQSGEPLASTEAPEPLPAPRASRAGSDVASHITVQPRDFEISYDARSRPTIPVLARPTQPPGNGVELAPGGADLSRSPTLADGGALVCPFPPEAKRRGIDAAVVTLRIEVEADSRVESVIVLADPGDGFGREARRCALAKRWQAGLDRAGKTARRTTVVNVRFGRNG